MNQAEFVDALQENLEESDIKITKANLKEVVRHFNQLIAQTVANGDKVLFVGFGTYEPVEHKPRSGRNPKTGEPLEISAKRVPKFAAGKDFKKLVADEL
jgi:nucleoid DNA-binding protein